MNKNDIPRTPFSTALSRSAKEVEMRLRNIFSGPKKRPPVLFLVLMFSICIFCGNLVSCQVKEAEATDTSSQPDSSRQEDSSVQSDQSAPPAADPDAAARAAYVKTLEDLLYRSTLPDGTECTPYSEENSGGFERMEDNTFAVADVDGDGREELVFLTRPNVHAGYRGYVLDYDRDSGAVRIQFDGYPSLTFYGNGALAEDDSHAQGVWSDVFWPHSLYRYLPETDSYELAGHLSAWEKQVSDNNPDGLPPFPIEKDTSGAGILYYIHPISSYEYLSNIESRINMAVDQSVYLEWLEPILEGAQPLELEYLPLTEENIGQIRMEGQ